METGSGNYLLPTAGKVLENVKAAGVDPAAIEAVLLTHMHPDHSAGLTDMATGKPNYPNAELVVHENEPRHWFDDAKMSAGHRSREEALFPGRARADPPLQGPLAPLQGRARCSPASPPSPATATRPAIRPS